VEKGIVAEDVLLTGNVFTIMAKKKYHKNVAEHKMFCIFAPTVPVLHTIRTAGGSFFLYTYGK